MIKIKKSELFEAFKARKDYAAYKLGLNAGKKFEGRWKESTEHAERVLMWLDGVSGDDLEVAEAQMTEDPTIAEELEPPAELEPPEHEPTEHEPTPERVEVAPATLPKDKTEWLQQRLDEEPGLRQQVIDASERAREAIAEASAKAADDVCAMVEAAKTGEPIPEPVPTGLLEVQYVLNEKTGLEEHVGSGEPVIIFDGFLRDAWKKLVDRHTADVNNWWREARSGEGLLRTCALIGQAACACIAANSSGWAKVCREIDLSKIFQTGPMSEEIGTMTASRGGKTVQLTLTREMVFDSYFLGNSYFGFDKGPYDGGTMLRDPVSLETLLAHAQGLRCPAAYKHATVAAVFPCLECYERESCYIRGPYAVCGCSDCEATVKMQEDGHEFFISERIKKFRKLIF